MSKVEASSISESISMEESEKRKQKPKLAYLIKSCDDYWDEYKDCRSFKAKFNQVFITGETASCDQWKTDYKNCKLWENRGDLKAADLVIESEKQRIRNRLHGHYNNNVWEPRQEPPADWNSPLPKKIQDGYENTFLKLKADQLKAGEEKLGDVDENIKIANWTLIDKDSPSAFCSIL